ncbi:Single Ig IL-1-related receptor [Plecturocebus cupreus]
MGATTASMSTPGKRPGPKNHPEAQFCSLPGRTQTGGVLGCPLVSPVDLDPGLVSPGSRPTCQRGLCPLSWGGVNVTSAEDYGTFTCSIQNVSSSSFAFQRAGDGGSLGRRGDGSGNPSAGLASHVAAVLASLLVLLALLLATVLYVKCRLNVLLWYQDTYGEVETNNGKLYDAYVFCRDCLEDYKFGNFILKQQLERRRGNKLFFDDHDLLPLAGPAPLDPRQAPAPPRDARPPAEPSADLLVNLSRCWRLFVVLWDAFLSWAWCNYSFRWVPRGVVGPSLAPPLTVPPRREGLCRLLEVTRRPILITFKGQPRDPAHPALRQLRQHRHLVTLLLWRPGSVLRWGRGRGRIARRVREGRCLGCRPRGLGTSLCEWALWEGSAVWDPMWGAALEAPSLRITAAAAGLFGARALEADDVRALPRVHTCKPPQPGPQTPSSDFWKELQLALPRKVHYRPVEEDPQTQLQDDKDPMLILQG